MISYEVQLIEQINSAQRILKALPLNLGGIAGASGGAGGPPGGFIGVLPQRKVAYDTTEAETLDTPLSGYSLLDNLNHIRYRIREVELGVISGFVENFLDLEDTPDTYVTYSGMAVIVNSSETGLEFVPFPSGGGGAGIPGGNDTNVQFNNAGAFEGTDFFKWDNANTGLYIGTPGTLPLDNGLIDLVSEGTDFDAKYQLWKFGDGATPAIVGIRSKGSYVSPSGLVPNDEIFGFWARGFNGTDWTDAQGSFQFVADETWSGSGTGVRAEMYITPRESTTLTLVQDWQSDFINMYRPINMFDHLISNVTDPIDPQDAVTKTYVDTLTDTLETSIEALREKLTAARTYYVGFDVGTVTMTIASPAVVTKTAHGLENDDPVIFRTTGALPTGIVAGTTYFVKNKTANTFEISATVGGASINTSGTQSGTHSAQTGNNDNDGLSTGRAGAFLTIQTAIDVVATLDSSIYDITIQLADGFYTAGGVLKNVVGAGSILIQGNSGTPANVLIVVTGGNVFTSSAVTTRYVLKDFEFGTITSGSCIVADKGSVVDFSNLRFRAAAADHIRCSFFAVVTAIGNYAVVGGAVRHMVAFVLGLIVTASRTITYSNSPAFSTANFVCQDLSECYVFNMTFTNGATVTGKRYDMSTNAVINTNGGGANYIPGNAVGTSATGAQYI